MKKTPVPSANHSLACAKSRFANNATLVDKFLANVLLSLRKYALFARNASANVQQNVANVMFVEIVLVLVVEVRLKSNALFVQIVHAIVLFCANEAD